MSLADFEVVKRLGKYRKPKNKYESNLSAICFSQNTPPCNTRYLQNANINRHSINDNAINTFTFSYLLKTLKDHKSHLFIIDG